MKIKIGNHTVLIDKDDFVRLGSLSPNKLRVQQRTNGKPNVILKVAGRVCQVARLIAGTKSAKRAVIALDGNNLNIQRANLKIVERRRVNYGRSKAGGKTSSFIGVHYYPPTGRWRAMIKPPKASRLQHLGYFDDERAAAAAYNAAAKRAFGDRANLNCI